MPFMRAFDEEADRAAVQGCLNDGATLNAMAYGLALTTTLGSLTDVAPGIYHVFLDGMSAAATVLLSVDRTAPASLVTPTATPQRLSMFPGNIVARIRVLPGKKVVSARLLSGTGDLYLVPVVTL